MKEKVAWNISEIARIFRCSRDTARKRLKEAG
ncbi:terminase small subunit, partial [Vibrio vulnificus]